MKHTALKKHTLRFIGLAGLLLFGTLFVFTFSIPDWVETAAQSFIEAEVEKQIDERIDALGPGEGDGALTRLASALVARNEDRIEAYKATLKARAHEQLADALTRIRDRECDCREQVAEILSTGFKFNIALLQQANDKLVTFIQTSYMEVASNLKRDIRIFTASNAVVYLMLLLASLSRRDAVSQLFLPGSLLAISTVICSWFYIFNQNWLFTIIYNDYTGYAYIGFLSLCFGFLCDIVFNRGRVTQTILG